MKRGSMKIIKFLQSSFCFALLLLTLSVPAYSKPGDLDPTFGTNGLAKTQLPGGAYLTGSALQNDGKIIVVGVYNYSGDQNKPFVARYNSDGSLDSTFGGTGIVTTFFVQNAPAGAESSQFYAVAIQSDGKIVAAGHAAACLSLTDCYDDPAVARFNPDGTLDATFGTGGLVRTQTGTNPGGSNGTSRIYGLAIGPDGSIYASGGGAFRQNDGSTSFNPIVLKYSSSGAVLTSTTFVISAAGFVGAANYAGAIKIQADGKPVIAVAGSQLTIKNFVIVRFNSDLSFDASFGNAGVAQTTFSALAQANGIVIDPDGKITVSGADNGGNSHSGNFYAARYNPDGMLDSTFGNAGKVTLLQPDPPHPPGQRNTYKDGGQIVRQPDGKYVIALSSEVGALRLLSSGIVDQTFGSNGIATYDGSDPAYPNLSGPGGLILLQPDGKIVLPSTVLNPVGALTGFIEIARLVNPSILAEIRTWTINGTTYAYVRLTFPNGSYSITDQGAVSQSGANYSANATIAQSGPPFVNSPTSTALIYNLGNAGASDYTFNFNIGGQSIETKKVTASTAPPAPNPIDDARQFVRQQYLDFLNREPDGPGWDFWTSQITSCGSDAACIDRKRVNTSGAYFLSTEFQSTGYFVYRFYKGSLNRFPTFSEFLADMQIISNGIVVSNALDYNKIEANKNAFAAAWVNRADFKTIFDPLSNQDYVDRLFQTTNVQVTDSDKSALVNALNNNSETRASVLRKVVDGATLDPSNGAPVFNTTYGQAFYRKEYNPAFVLMQYFGYLRRDIDSAGYQFWLAKLNQFGNFTDAEMVRSFIISAEYRSRFGQP